MNLTNTVKEKLAAGEKVFGCFIPLPTPEIVEIVALAGFDFALIDNEHGPITAQSAYPMVLAAEAHGIEAMARVGLGERQEVLKFLDIGMSGIMAPRVGTAEEAAAAISYTKYSPVGDRGRDTRRPDASGVRTPQDDAEPAGSAADARAPAPSGLGRDIQRRVALSPRVREPPSAKARRGGPER